MGTHSENLGLLDSATNRIEDIGLRIYKLFGSIV